MKITKKNSAVKAAEVVCLEKMAVPVAEVAVTAEPLCKYNDAICLIQSAIENLASCPELDDVAKDSIANLSVVLMDLKSAC